MSLPQLARNRTMWSLAIACAASSAASATLAFWQPQFLKGFGLTDQETGLLNAVPYGISVIALIFWSAHSDRTGERRWHAALPLIVIAAGFTGLFLFGSSLLVAVALLSSILIGYTSFKGPFWALTSQVLSPTTAAAGIAGINAVATLIGGATVFLVGVVQQATSSFGTAMLPIVLVSLAGAALTLLVGRRLPKAPETVGGPAPSATAVH